MRVVWIVPNLKVDGLDKNNDTFSFFLSFFLLAGWIELIDLQSSRSDSCNRIILIKI